MPDEKESFEEMFKFGDGPTSDELMLARLSLRQKQAGIRLSFSVQIARGMLNPIDIFIYEIERDSADKDNWILRGSYALEKVKIIFHTLARQGIMWKKI